MGVIDLTTQGDGYKVITFPDGEVHLELLKQIKVGEIEVRCRITNATDLFILMQLSDILKRQGVIITRLIIYYLMGMRCDRVFDINRPFTLNVVADVINSLEASCVDIVEPHSFRSELLINHSMNIPATLAMVNKYIAKNIDNVFFVAPDHGAVERYGEVFPFAVICSKVRDASTGELLDFKAEEVFPVKDRNLIMIDDLCDGGGTFVGLAPKIRELGPKSLSLAVTHAVQMNGIKRVAEVYDKVYITNTFKEWQNEDIPKNVVVVNISDNIL